MGIFSKKTEDKKPKAKKAEVKTDAPVAKEAKKEGARATSTDLHAVIRNPRITEKAAHVSDNRVYTFDVAPKATKLEIDKAVKSIYGVTPIKINILAIAKKTVYRRNSLGVKGGGKKAYVYLKKGDKIEFI